MENDKSKTEYEKEQKAIREYLKRQKENIKRPYQAGSPAKDQQRLKDYGNLSKKDDFVYPNIKKQLKDNHKHIDIVFMQGWITEYHVAEEDAELIKKLDKDKIYDDNCKSYPKTSIKFKEKKVFINKLNKLNKGYAFLDKIKGTNPVMRKIVDCSDKNLIGDKY